MSTVAICCTFGGARSSLAYLPAIPLAIGLWLAVESKQTHQYRLDPQRRLRGPRFALIVGILVCIQIVATAILNPNDSVLTTTTLIASLLISAMAWNYFTSLSVDRTLTTIYWTITATGLAFVAFIAPKVVGGGLLAWTTTSENSTWLNHNSLGAYFLIGLSIPLARLIQRKAKLSDLFGATALFLAVVVTFSRSAYLALAVLLVMALLLNRRLVLLGIVAAGAVMFWAPKAVSGRVFYTTSGGQLDPSSETRIAVWEAAWDAALDNPLWGVGIPSLHRDLGPLATTGQLSYAHNTYLTMAAGLGLLLTVLIVGGLIALLRHLVNPKNRTSASIAGLLSIASLCVCSFFGEPILIPLVAIPAVALVASSFSKVAKCQEVGVSCRSAVPQKALNGSLIRFTNSVKEGTKSASSYRATAAFRRH